MSIVFPSLKPSQRQFSLGVFPTKVYRSLSGTAIKRSFGNRPNSYQLTLEFENVSDSIVSQIIAHYNSTSGGFSRFSLPLSIFSGMDTTLTGQTREPGGIRWEYAAPPSVRSIYRDTSTVSVQLLGDDSFSPTAAPIPVSTSIVSENGGGSVGDVTDNNNITSSEIVDNTIVDADINDSAAIAASKLSFLQAGTGARSRTVDSKFQDCVSVLDFIPEAEHAAIRDRSSTYNCAASFQAALDAHTSVYVPAGRYTIGSTLTVSNKSIHLYGDGERISTLRFTGGTHGLSWSSNVASLIKVENLDFLADAVMSGSPVRAVYTAGSAPQYGGAFMENVLAHDLSSPNKWTDGFHFTDCQVNITDCVFLGRASTGLTGSGFKFSGFNVDCFVYGCQVNEANIAYDISGTSEGMSITNSTCILCNIGVLWNPSNTEPLLCVIGSHFNTITDGIRLTNCLQSFISNCLFYANTETGTAPGYTAIKLLGGTNRDIVIADSVFHGTIYTGSKTGVRLENAERVTIENNIFKNMDLAVEMQASASNCQAVGNIYEDNVTTRISNAGANNYHSYMANGELRIDHFAASLGAAVEVDRKGSDGDLIRFYQAGILEGAISVNGSTVTYGGGHLARWSQLPNNENPAHILKGTVMTNLEEMCEWGEELNEQLNKTRISFTEGDVNVAGVFVALSPSNNAPLDFFVAMTGDMIIRIGKDISVARGDLLMSAGDGTAKPQDDDIIKSKTIAKVTSAHVSCVYDDGSYCVPCVLMAC